MVEQDVGEGGFTRFSSEHIFDVICVEPHRLKCGAPWSEHRKLPVAIQSAIQTGVKDCMDQGREFTCAGVNLCGDVDDAGLLPLT